MGAGIPYPHADDLVSFSPEASAGIGARQIDVCQSVGSLWQVPPLHTDHAAFAPASMLLPTHRHDACCLLSFNGGHGGDDCANGDRCYVNATAFSAETAASNPVGTLLGAASHKRTPPQTQFLSGNSRPSVQPPGGGKASRASVPMRTLERKEYEEPGANFSLDVQVQVLSPEESKPGGPIIPIDARRRDLRQHTAEAAEKLKEEEQVELKERLRRFEKGETVPDEGRVLTPGEIAHQLMQSGDYDDGPPFPLEYEVPPPWRRKGAELALTTEVKVQKLGAGKGEELVRCFKGNEEAACGFQDAKRSSVNDMCLAASAVAHLAFPSVGVVGCARGQNYSTMIRSGVRLRLGFL